MKDIKDYLHLYLGCKVLVDGETSGSLIGLSHTYDVELYVNNQWLHHRFCKLILRPLSDMTEEEQEAYEMYYMSLEHQREEDHHSICEVEIAAHTTKWLLSKGFDLFGLIEVGLAIDKTTIKN